MKICTRCKKTLPETCSGSQHGNRGCYLNTQQGSLRIKTSELIGSALDWAVAKAEGYIDNYNSWLYDATLMEVDDGSYNPSTDWSQGGPIIEREKIDTNYDIHWEYDPSDPEDNGERWFASCAGNNLTGCYGSTPLIAAMRCFCASRLGDEVEIPEGLL